MFGFDILDAGLVLASLLAFAGGLLSFLSPCVLPIVPPYLAYMSGISVGEMKGGRSPILAALLFVMGLSTVFVLLGVAATGFGAEVGEAAWATSDVCNRNAATKAGTILGCMIRKGIEGSARGGVVGEAPRW